MVQRTQRFFCVTVISTPICVRDSGIAGSPAQKGEEGKNKKKKKTAATSRLRNINLLIIIAETQVNWVWS